jgi:RNA polymerase sigma-70 factor (sigma-E family)
MTYPMTVDQVADDRRRRRARMRRQSFEDLFLTYGPSAKRLAYLLTGSEPAAEDVVQEAFLRMFRRFGDLRDPDSFASYLRRTIVNLCIDIGRKQQRERLWRGVVAAGISQSTPSPEGTYEARSEMWRALLKLAPRQRIVLVLRYYEDLTESQTADVMGCSVGTVKAYASRGLQALRHGMEP